MKKLLLLFLACLLMFSLTACNKKIIDTTYTFKEAIISLPDGSVVKGKVDSWRDYEGEQIQVVIEGTTYLVHSNNLVLIKN